MVVCQNKKMRKNVPIYSTRILNLFIVQPFPINHISVRWQNGLFPANSRLMDRTMDRKSVFPIKGAKMNKRKKDKCTSIRRGQNLQ